jgi:hypothetical protein
MQHEDSESGAESVGSLFESPSRLARGLVIVVLRIIQWLFVIVAWTFWAVFGTAFWFALVFRVLAVYSATFLYAMFTYQTPMAIERRLRFVTNLWFDGFLNAYASVFGKREAPPLALKHSQLLLEISWSMFFWAGNLVLLSLQSSQRTLPLIAVSIGVSAFIVGLFLGTWKGEPILRFLRLRPKD